MLVHFVSVGLEGAARVAHVVTIEARKRRKMSIEDGVKSRTIAQVMTHIFGTTQHEALGSTSLVLGGERGARGPGPLVL